MWNVLYRLVRWFERLQNPQEVEAGWRKWVTPGETASGLRAWSHVLSLCLLTEEAL